MILPVESLGTDYRAIGHYPPTENTQIGIVAVENNTEVAIFLTDRDFVVRPVFMHTSYLP